MKKISTLSIITLGVFCAFSLSVNSQTFTEGFEGTFPPTGWSVDNPDGLYTFTQANVGQAGSKSAFVDAFNMAQGEQGQSDALITGVINMSSITNPSMTVYYANQMWSDPSKYTTADAFNVYASTDGGTTWNSIFNKTGNTLSTATPAFDSTLGFVPVSSEWKMETINISSVATSSSVKFKFEFINDWENNFYIDEIKLSGTGSSVNELSIDAFVTVFPNPSNGNFNVDLMSNDFGQTEIVIYNMVGEVVEQVSYNILSPKRVKFNLENQPNGVYFVKVKTENGSSTKKLIINN